MSRRYLIITPCRDEEAHIQSTIDSIVAQTLRPGKWLIVDDGSTDRSGELIRKAALQHPFIQIVVRENRGFRAVGDGVIETFNFGLGTINLAEFDYVCKLDGDLELGARYFETLVGICESNPCLGTVSGKLYLRKERSIVEERCGDENSVGPVKFYRTACFKQIGGFVQQVGWDGIDGHLCRMRGWMARSFEHPDLRIIHLRQMGSSQGSLWAGRVRWGRGKYLMGSAFYYLLVVALYRVFERPYILGSLGIAVGYLKAMKQREKRFECPGYLDHLTRFELSSLLRGKRRTMRRYHDHLQRGRPQPVQTCVPLDC